ncbi:MAG: C10 family peptidase [Prolixibacteraceae bacterium]|jgi:PKD repeat protein|nr:C10 family peptidase [Prolixibacteraceae bacterium]
MKITLSTLYTVLCILSSSILYAQPININKAKEIGKNHLLRVRTSNLKLASIKQNDIQFSSVSTAVINQDTLYYVLNDTINKGFIIVSADKRVWPILGYSLDGKFSESNQPPAFIDWMEQRKQEIAHIKKNNLPIDDKTTQEWDKLSSSNSNSSLETTLVEPLLQTTWDQGCYYNSLCPSDINGKCGHVWTGCVATSMAQIMKYWNYPTTGTGSHSYSHSTYGTLSADFGSTTYQWSQMPNNVTNENSAVATLMYHCGVSVDMKYGTDGSSASYSGTTLVNYFKYSASAEYVYRSNYSSQEWENLLKFELNSNRPIWYRGEGWSGGHAFVCDGYRNADDFHFNWGWGGYADGYFFIGNLNPSDKYYNDNQGAVIKIFPSSTPNAVGPISGNTVVCQGQNSVNYSVVAISNAASYVWTLPNGATGTSTTNSINVDFGNTAQSGIIKIRGQNASGNGPESSLTITVNPAPGAPGTITGNQMVCPGISELYSVPPVSGAISYTWVLPSGWTGSSTSTSITVIPGSSSGTISVKANNSSCSGSASLLSVTNGVPNSPTSATASQTTIIAGQSTILQVVGGNLNSAPNWAWYTGRCGGTLVGNGTTLSVSPLSTTTYYVQATGCGISTTCRSITINVCTAPTAPKTSSASIGSPANGSNHYLNFSVENVSDADGYSWDYSWDGINWQINWYQNYYTSLYWNLGDQPNIPVYFRVRAYKCSPKQYSNYTYTLPQPIYTACDFPSTPAISGITSNSLNITLNSELPVANPSITTYSIYCSTSSQYVQANGTLGSTEVFQTKSAWGTKTITGLSSSKQYCFYAKARNNNGDIRFNSLNSGCGTTINGPPTASFSATPASGCTPMIVNFIDGSEGNITAWAWDIDNNGTVDYTTQNPSHTYTTAGTYTVKLTVTNSFGSDSKVFQNLLTVNPLPVSAGVISGTSAVCQGQNAVIYTVPTVANSTSYVWTLPTGATGISTTNSITVNYGTSAVSGNIAVKGHNACGDGVSSTLAITINPLPANAGSISGTSMVCQGQNAVTYTVPAIANASAYMWTLPAGATGTSTTNSINVNYETSAISGNITVKGHNTCGDGAVSSLAVTVNALPSGAGTIIGTSSVCQGQNAVTYTVPIIANAISCLWSLPSGASGSSTTNSIIVNYGVSAVSGNIKVKGHNACGDGVESALVVNVYPVPVAPVISINSGILQSNSSSGNQWVLDNIIIQNAVNYQYTPSQAGNYYVIVTLNGCASPASNAIAYIPTGIEEVVENKGISMYPNPTTGLVKIVISDKMDSNYSVDVYNSNGSLLRELKKDRSVSDFDVDLSQYPAGIYIISIKSTGIFYKNKVAKRN